MAFTPAQIEKWWAEFKRTMKKTEVPSTLLFQKSHQAIMAGYSGPLVDDLNLIVREMIIQGIPDYGVLHGEELNSGLGQPINLTRFRRDAEVSQDLIDKGLLVVPYRHNGQEIWDFEEENWEPIMEESIIDKMTEEDLAFITGRSDLFNFCKEYPTLAPSWE